VKGLPNGIRESWPVRQRMVVTRPCLRHAVLQGHSKMNWELLLLAGSQSLARLAHLLTSADWSTRIPPEVAVRCCPLLSGLLRWRTGRSTGMQRFATFALRGIASGVLASFFAAIKHSIAALLAGAPVLKASWLHSAHLDSCQRQQTTLGFATRCRAVIQNDEEG
jgi:hypothetical protein